MHWNDLSLRDKSDLMRLYIKNGIYSLEEMKKDFNESSNKYDMGEGLDGDLIKKVNKSNANFVNRLKDPNRKTIKDWDSNNISTHKLSYVTDDKGNAIIYPEIQEIDGMLYDFTDPKNNAQKWDSYKSAVNRGDTIMMTPKQAEFFTKNYKSYYPGFNNYYIGGPLDENPPKMTPFILGTGFDRYGRSVVTEEDIKTEEQQQKYNQNMWQNAQREVEKRKQQEGLKTLGIAPLSPAEKSVINYSNGLIDENSIRTANLREGIRKAHEESIRKDLELAQDNPMMYQALHGVVPQKPLVPVYPESALIGGWAAKPTLSLLNAINKSPLGRAVSLYGTYDGIKNLFTDNGVSKTVRKAKEGDIWGTVKSGVGDVFDLFGFWDTAKFGRNFFNRAYRAGHAYNTITPIGYYDLTKRFKSFGKALLSNRTPIIDERTFRKKLYNKIKKASPHSNWRELLTFVHNREDAYRLYLGFPQKYNTYIKNSDGTYRYSNRVLESPIVSLEPTIGGKYDYVGYNAGSLWNISDYAEDPKTHRGVLHMVDRWDLNPLEDKVNRDGELVAFRYLGKYLGNVPKRIASNIYNKSYNKLFSIQTKPYIRSWAYPEIGRPLNKYAHRGRPFIPHYYDELKPTFLDKKFGNWLKKYDPEWIIGGKSFMLDQYIPYRIYGDDLLVDHKRSMDNFYDLIKQLQQNK